MRFRGRYSLFVVAVPFALAATLVAAGCTDEDPNYGPPEAIRGRMIDFGLDASTGTTPTGEGGGGGPTTPRGLFTPLHTSIMGTCTPCHQAGGSGTIPFVGKSEDDSYSLFKTNNFQNLTVPAPNGFFLKGLHTGPALTADQQALTKAWSAAELAGGTGTPDSGAPAPVADAGGD
jgi:hypothetical protein